MNRIKSNKFNRGSHAIAGESELPKASRVFRLLEFLILFFLMLAALVLVVNLIYGKGSYVSKFSIKSDVFKVINNGGDLRAVRNVYENREVLSWSLPDLFRGYEDYYDYLVPMSKILEDVRSDFFLKVKEDGFYGGVYGYLDKGDEKSLARIDDILQENEKINPFEGLEPAQKDNFENIRIKLDGDYDLVARDMEKLSSDLKVKNDLVGQYLKDSTISFWVSVFALVFSLIISVYQIYVGRDSRLKFLISSAVSESKASLS